MAKTSSRTRSDDIGEQTAEVVARRACPGQDLDSAWRAGNGDKIARRVCTNSTGRRFVIASVMRSSSLRSH